MSVLCSDTQTLRLCGISGYESNIRMEHWLTTLTAGNCSAQRKTTNSMEQNPP